MRYEPYIDCTLSFIARTLRTRNDVPAYVRRAVSLPPVCDEPLSVQAWDQQLLDIQVQSHNPRHAGWLAHMNGGPVTMAALSNFVVDVLGNNAIVEDQAPAAYAAKEQLAFWISKLLGWTPECELAAYESGSLSNLHAMVEARDRARAAGVFDSSRHLLDVGVVLCSELAHQSVFKALKVLGFSEANVRSIPCNACGQLSVSGLRKGLVQLTRQGKIPFLVILTAGTTTLGTVDPIEHTLDAVPPDAWVHLDGAFGGSLIFGHRHRLATKSFSRIDSISFNPHKLLNAPCGSALLAFQKRCLTFSQSFGYASSANGARPNAEWMLSGSQRPILLSFYLMVRALGSSGIARIVDSHMDRAIEFAELVRKLGYIVLTEPMTPLVVFRHPKVLDEIALHALCERMAVSGVFLSTTTFAGSPWFRAVLINPDICIDKVSAALDEIAREL